jgi:SAM-dependent methyltransferase
MSAEPPQAVHPPEPEMHRHRAVAESYGTDAARYDRTRQPYPDALVDRIIATSPGRDVLDVGCGTGIAAQQFQAAGCTVLGVDPDIRMAAFARRRGVDVEVAAFETWDPAGRTFDAIIAGTAWHWVDPVAGAAKAARVLRPAGRLAPFHHVFQSPPELTEALATAYRRAASDSPVDISQVIGPALGALQPLDAFQPLFAKIADGIRQVGGFGEPEQWRFHWEHIYTQDEWLDQLPTLVGLGQLPPDKVPQVLDGLAAAIDAMGGSFTMPYTTVAITAARSSTT